MPSWQDQTLNNIQRAPMIEEPYRYKFLPQVFPHWVYGALLDSMPSKEDFVVRQGYGMSGKTLFCRKKVIGNVPLWAELDAFLESEYFIETVTACVGLPNEGRSCYFVSRDLDQHSIAPHRDVKQKLVTYVFYLARDMARPDWGTWILRPKGEMVHDDKTKEWDEMLMARLVSFVPNTGVIWQVQEQSYHGVHIDKDEDDIHEGRDAIRGAIFRTDIPLPKPYSEDYPAMICKETT